MPVSKKADFQGSVSRWVVSGLLLTFSDSVATSLWNGSCTTNGLMCYLVGSDGVQPSASNYAWSTGRCYQRFHYAIVDWHFQRGPHRRRRLI